MESRSEAGGHGAAGIAGTGSSDLVSILDAIDLAVIIATRNGDVSQFNQAAATAFGLRRDHIGKPLGALPILSRHTDLESHCAEALAGGSSRQDLVDGDRRFALRVSRFNGPSQEADGVVLTFTNVTAYRAHLEQALYDREYTKAILNTIVEGLVVLDGQLAVQTANRAFYALFSVSRDAAQGMPLANLADEKWRNLPLWNSLKALLETDAEVIPVEIECDLPQLGTRTLLCDARRLSRNTKATLVVVLQDVTERKRAADAIRKNERRFHEMLDALPAAVYTTDADGCITYFNATALALSGREPQAGIDHWCVTWKLFRADGTPLPHDECPMAVSLKEGHPIRGAELITERPDGARVWIEPFPTPIFDSAGALVGGINMLVDITERKRAEQVFRRQHEQFRRLIDNVPLGVYIIDQDFRVQQVNPVALPVFANITDLIGCDFADLVHVLWHEEYANEIIRRFRHTLETGEPYIAPESNEERRDRGVTEHYEWRIERIPLPDGSHGVVCYFRDVSAIANARIERERLLESERLARMEADKAARMKDEFLAVLSHELRSPLNAILGWTHILKRGGVDPSYILQSAEVIERNAKLQAQVISDLLDMSRINAGKLRLAAEEVDIQGIVAASVESIRPSANAKGIAIALHAEDVKGFVLGDSSRLEQVLANLLSNAIKFTPQGGSIDVSLVAGKSEVEIRVADSGEGIDPEFLPFLFDRFRQADLSTARTHGGLGLGLALVKQLTELHGGSVTAASAGRSKGATFLVRLPLAIDRTLKGTRADLGRVIQGTEHDALELDGVCVLVVDDDADFAEVVGRVLIERRAEVVSASDAAEALACLHRRKIDVVVSDIGMPDMDGYSLMREIRRRGITTPAAALTAFGRQEDREMALRAGYQAYITKPIDFSQMLVTIAALAGKIPGI